MTQKTLLLIKPNAVQAQHIGHIISIVEEHGFLLMDVKVLKFCNGLAEEFYIAHKGKEFYQRLLEFMCSGETVALLLKRTNAIEKLRELVGSADPAERAPNTIRHLYANGVTENAVHASDSEEAAKREIELIFGYY